MACRGLDDTEPDTLREVYLLACDERKLPSEVSTTLLSLSSRSPLAAAEPVALPLEPPQAQPSASPTLDGEQPAEVLLKAKKKYKPVALKVRPIVGELPKEYRIVRNRIGDPLQAMPKLDPNPTPYAPTGRYTAERRDQVRADHQDFLWPAELDLVDDLMCKQNDAFAWDDAERGTFRADMFPDVRIGVVPHVPFIERNFPIPPGIYKQASELIKRKISSGVYEPSNASYRSRWFCVLKKNGDIRIVHSLEPLNRITIQHSGVPPIPEHLAEQFAGRACGATLDLYVGYDERRLAEESRDLTTFQTPFGAMRLTTLPMGWSNSVPIFHDDVTFILQPEIPHVTIPYIDDVPIKGPATDYRDAEGNYETIPSNPGIRRFVWEHLLDVNRVVQHMKHAGGTFSGKKLVLCAAEIVVVGHRCTPEGRRPETKNVDAIVNWGPCRDLSEVRAFLGTVGVARIFIKNFAKKAHPLVKLTRKDVPFEFGAEQLQAMAELKRSLLESPALRAIDHESEAPVILAVDTSYIAVGYQLCQQDLADARIRYYSRFGSITLNEREARFSQPKLELYGLYRALKALKFYLLGVRNLVIEVDARYIKGMLDNPDIAPAASVNRWIIGIRMFHFELVHVPGEHHGPDGLSRRPRQPGDRDEVDDDEFDDWVDNLYGFLHLINPPPRLVDADLADPDREPTGTVDVLFQQTAGTTAKLPTVTAVEYSKVPRSPTAQKLDERVDQVKRWLLGDGLPTFADAQTRARFERYAGQFFVDKAGRLWKLADDGAHRRVLDPSARGQVLVEFHDYVGHRGIYATKAFLADRFWWPEWQADVAWYVRTCHQCQVRQTRKVHIPPTVAYPSPPMVRVHADTMDMPAPYKHFFHARCATTSYCEGRAAKTQSAKTIGDWIYQDLLCRWGAIAEIVTDNGAPFVAAMEYIDKTYHVRHIRISGYNSQANGTVERPHFHVRDALIKACSGDAALWPSRVYSVMWSDRITVRRGLGCCPYFAVTGTNPLHPLDIVEATYLMPTPTELIPTSDLIARRAIALQKRPEQLATLRSTVFQRRVAAAHRFEAEHKNVIKDFNFPSGRLVLMRNTAIEKSLNRKTRPRYIGPMVVVGRNRGGAYLLAELDGAVLDRPVAAFRLIPYFAREDPIPLLADKLDLNAEQLQRLQDTTVTTEDLAELEGLADGEDE